MHAVVSQVGEFLIGLTSTDPRIGLMVLGGIAFVAPSMASWSDQENREYAERWGRDADEVEWLAEHAARTGLHLLDWAEPRK